VGSLLAFASAALELRGGDGRAAYQRARQGVGRPTLLGLEVLIIADIVLTMEIELEGSLPGVAARPRSRRPQPSASATDQDERALGYRSWGGVPDACRQVRATRRSPSP
jgi:Protein of unknown function (DUF1622)